MARAGAGNLGEATELVQTRQKQRSDGSLSVAAWRSLLTLKRAVRAEQGRECLVGEGSPFSHTELPCSSV